MRRNLLLIVWAISVATVIYAKAQERDPSYPTTRTWRAWELPDVDWYTKAKVDVIDTPGVCLYVIRGFMKDTVGIAAVPKTQLPAGKGCQ